MYIGGKLTMKKNRMIIGICCAVVGIGLFAFSDYITKQVAAGRGQVYHAQSAVNTANKLFDKANLKDVGSTLTGGVQNKINKGRSQIASYELLSFFLKIGGVVLVIFAFIYALMIPFFKKS